MLSYDWMNPTATRILIYGISLFGLQIKFESWRVTLTVCRPLLGLLSKCKPRQLGYKRQLSGNTKWAHPRRSAGYGEIQEIRISGDVKKRAMVFGEFAKKPLGNRSIDFFRGAFPQKTRNTENCAQAEPIGLGILRKLFGKDWPCGRAHIYLPSALSTKKNELWNSWGMLNQVHKNCSLGIKILVTEPLIWFRNNLLNNRRIGGSEIQLIKDKRLYMNF